MCLHAFDKSAALRSRTAGGKNSTPGVYRGPCLHEETNSDLSLKINSANVTTNSTEVPNKDLVTALFTHTHTQTRPFVPPLFC